MPDRDELRTDQVYKGDVWFTGTATFEHAVHLLDGVEIDAASILTGVLTHEVGGLEADVSAFNGLVKISAGATSAVTLTAFGASLLDDADAAAARTTLGLAAIAASGSWSDLSGTPTTLAGYGITDAASDAELTTHAGLTSGVHGITAFAATFLDDADAAAARTTLGLAAIAASGSWSDLSGTPTTLAGYGITDAASDAELTTHAGLTSGVHGITAFGASITAAANAGAVRTLLGLDALAVSGDWADLNGMPAAIDAIDGLTPAANQLAYYTGASTASLTNLSTLARSLIAQTSEAAMRGVLDLEAIAASGSYSDLVSIPAAIDAIDGLTPAANKLAYYISGSGAALTDLTSFGRNLIDDADAAAGRSTLGLGSLATLSTVGTSQLTDDAVTYAKIQDVSATDRLLGRSTAGAGVIEEITCTAAGRALLDDASAAAQRTTLGVGTGDTPTFAGLRANYVNGLIIDDAGTPLGQIYYSGGFLFNRASGAAFFLQENGSTQFQLAAGGNCTITKMLTLSNTSAPGSYPAVQLWADSGELKVADTSGNVTTLSPHADDGPPAIYDEPAGLEWVIPHVNAFRAEVRWYNQTRLHRKGNKPSLVIESFAEYNARLGLAPEDPRYLAALSWEEHEDALAAAAEADRDAWQAAKDEDDARRAALKAAGKDPGEPRVKGPKPPAYVKRPKPAWVKRA